MGQRQLLYLRGDDVEKVPGGGKFLSEHVAVLRLKEHVQDFDDERAAAERARQAVLPQEVLQLRLVLGDKLQRDLGACKSRRLNWAEGRRRVGFQPWPETLELRSDACAVWGSAQAWRPNS